jgi:hypothetical protein
MSDCRRHVVAVRPEVGSRRRIVTADEISLDALVLN